MHGDANSYGRGNGQITEKGLLGEFRVLQLEEKIILRKEKTYHLLDVNKKRGFRLFGFIETESSEAVEHVPQDPVSCDMIAIRQQPTGELIPGVAVALRREANTDKAEREDTEVPGFAFAASALISVDELADLASLESTPASDNIIVRSAVKMIRIF